MQLIDPLFHYVAIKKNGKSSSSFRQLQTNGNYVKFFVKLTLDDNNKVIEASYCDFCLHYEMLKEAKSIKCNYTS